jgi:hypothetical protein
VHALKVKMAIWQEAIAYDERIYYERKEKEYGTARISLSCLQFPGESPTHLNRLEKDVQKLESSFRIQPLTRLASKEYYISALISQSQLETALRQSNITARDLRSKDLPPRLIIDPSCPLQCIQGERRLKAAGKTLEAGDDWWTVDLFAHGTGAKSLSLDSNTDINV